ncbi:MAG TPA: two-component regulator propeller domain-containing protein [Bacteroidota bacterium]
MRSNVHLAQHSDAVPRWYRTGMNALFISAFLLICAPPGLPAQSADLKYEVYSLEQGLSQSSVRCILRDNKGFLWFGTGDGLNRFDGYNFQVFHHDPQDSGSLGDDNVWTLAQDPSGRIWIGTERGLNAYDPGTDRFTRPENLGEFRHPWMGGRILRLVVRRSNRLWVAASKGTLVLDLTARRIQTSFASLRGTYPVYPLAELSDETLWISSFDSIYRAPRGRDSLEPARLPFQSNSLVISVNEDRSGVLWFGTIGDGLFEFDPKTGHSARHLYYSTQPKLFDNQVRGAIEDPNGRLWVGTRNIGLTLFDRDRHTFSRFTPRVNEQANLRFETITSMYMDPSGVLWAGYDGSGIVRISTKPKKFEHVLLPSSGSEGSGESFLKPLMVDRSGAIWAGTYDKGLVVMDRGYKLLRRYLHTPEDPSGISSNTILSLLEDRAGTLFVGTAEGLDELDPGSDRIGHPGPAGSGKNRLNSIITALCRDSGGAVWVGTASGLFTLDRSAGTLVPEAGFTGEIKCLTASPDGTLWVGTAGRGLAHLDPRRHTLTAYVHDPSAANSLSYDIVKCITPGEDGALWIGTESGLNRFDPRTGNWKRYYTKDGLPNDFIYGILTGRDGRLWISTNGGLSRMDPKETDHPGFRNYTPGDGLQSFEFNTNCYFKTPDGRLFFGGVNGFNVFDPDSVRDNPVIPPVVITGFKKFDQPVVAGFVPGETREVTLEYTESVFSFEFAGLEFTNPGGNRYAYAMEGFDREWMQSGTRREARYTNLDPGTYTFRVKASNNDGVWNEAGTSMRVVILPPFWRRGWFIAMSVALVAGGFGGAVRYVSVRKLKTKLREMEYQRHLEEERERISRDLHDNVGAQLVSILSGLDLVRKYSHPADERTDRLLTSLHEDARSSISQLRETIWALKSGGLNLPQFAEFVESYARRQTDFSHDLELTVRLADNLPFVLSPMQALNCFRIVQEALTNCLKHAGATRVDISMVSLTNGRFSMTIADNGIGAGNGQPELFSGNGLNNMRQRAGELGGTADFGAPPGGGFEVRVNLPILHPDGTA